MIRPLPQPTPLALRSHPVSSSLLLHMRSNVRVAPRTTPCPRNLARHAPQQLELQQTAVDEDPSSTRPALSFPHAFLPPNIADACPLAVRGHGVPPDCVRNTERNSTAKKVEQRSGEAKRLISLEGSTEQGAVRPSTDKREAGEIALGKYSSVPCSGCSMLNRCRISSNIRYQEESNQQGNRDSCGVCFNL